MSESAVVPVELGYKPKDTLHIYTDGSCITFTDKRWHPTPRRYAGVGIWYGTDDLRNVSMSLRSRHDTNQVAELTAINYAISTNIETMSHLCIYTDSMYSINCVTLWNLNWEKNGWTNAKNKPVCNQLLIREILEKIDLRKEKGYETIFVHVKAHSGIEGNEGADTLANDAAKRLIHEAEVSSNIGPEDGGVFSAF